MHTNTRKIYVAIMALTANCSALPTFNEIPEHKKWAYISGLLPEHNAGVVEPSIGAYTGAGAIIGVALAIIAMAVLIAHHDNPSPTPSTSPEISPRSRTSLSFGFGVKSRINSILDDCVRDQSMQMPLFAGGSAIACSASIGAAIGAIAWLSAKLYNTILFARFKRLETIRSADYILATPVHLLPAELPAIIEDYKKDQDKLRLVRRVQMAITWYKEMSLASIFAWAHKITTDNVITQTAESITRTDAHGPVVC